jgi:hypothetical protein
MFNHNRLYSYFKTPARPRSYIARSTIISITHNTIATYHIILRNNYIMPFSGVDGVHTELKAQKWKDERKKVKRKFKIEK